MINLNEALIASLSLTRPRAGEARRDIFAEIGFDRDDLRAARERQKRRS